MQISRWWSVALIVGSVEPNSASPTVYTADAAQFYEEVRGSDILETLKLLLQFSEQRGIFCHVA